MYPQKALCQHTRTTLVQDVDTLNYFLPDEPGGQPLPLSFVCHQCDHCGMITRKEVTFEEIEQSGSLPWLDKLSYLDAMSALHQSPEERETQALRFMLRAVRG